MSITLESCDPVVRRSVDLLVDFVSSAESGNGRNEEFGDADGFGAWARERMLGDTADQPSAADAAAARELRGALITMFRAHCDCPTAPVEEDEQFLRRAARRYPVTTVVSAGGCRFEAAQSGVPGIFGGLLAAAACVASQGLWLRIKMCKNPNCYAGFYDKTRNLSGQFCGSACNSQVSMRAYRERQKTA